MNKTLSEILHALGERRGNYFHAVAPPVIQSSNFAFPDIASFRNAITTEDSANVYSRGNNPTVQILRDKLAALEHTEDALVTASGSAAIAMAVMSRVRAGDHVVCVKNPYSWTKALLAGYLPKYGVETTFVDGTDLVSIENAVQSNSTLLYLESPNTLTFELQDLAACAGIAKRHNLVTIIDNSNATPIFQNPADFGIDIIIHSISKYLNGHNDVVAGAVCGSKDHIKQMFFDEYMTLGAVISPSDAALVIRGLRTLDMRVRRSFESAIEVSAYLNNHESVEELIFPWSDDFPQYKIAREQMRGCGGLITVKLKAESMEAVYRFVNALSVFQIAVSWGGYNSLVLPIAALYGLANRDDPEVSWSVLRLFIGMENPKELIADLKKGFRAMGKK